MYFSFGAAGIQERTSTRLIVGLVRSENNTHPRFMPYMNVCSYFKLTALQNAKCKCYIGLVEKNITYYEFQGK